MKIEPLPTKHLEIVSSEKRQAGVGSVETAAQLLRALAEAEDALNLKDLAAASGMTMSKAHRYLVSLGRSGLVHQDPATNRYDLGTLALSMGLTALGRVDPIRFATEALPDLRDRLGETAILAVWGEHGATVIRIEEGPQKVRMNIRVGCDLPATRSAVGQLFTAFLPRAVTDPVIADERARFGAAAPPEAEFARILDDVRQQGLSRIVGRGIPGVSAFSAPVLDDRGDVVAAICVVGYEAMLDVSWDGPVAVALRDITTTVSRRLGFNGAMPGDPPAREGLRQEELSVP